MASMCHVSASRLFHESFDSFYESAPLPEISGWMSGLLILFYSPLLHQEICAWESVCRSTSLWT